MGFDVEFVSCAASLGCGYGGCVVLEGFAERCF